MEYKEIPVINNSCNELPKYAKDGDAGMDLRAWVSSKEHSFVYGTVRATDQDGNPIINIMPGGRCKIDTGLHIQLPYGWEAQIRPRSGISLKQGLIVITGTVDCRYVGSIGIILINLSTEMITIHEGDRIAQMVIAETKRATLTPAIELKETERGDGGFGSSGIK